MNWKALKMMTKMTGNNESIPTAKILDKLFMGACAMWVAGKSEGEAFYPGKPGKWFNAAQETMELIREIKQALDKPYTQEV